MQLGSNTTCGAASALGTALPLLCGLAACIANKACLTNPTDATLHDIYDTMFHTRRQPRYFEAHIREDGDVVDDGHLFEAMEEADRQEAKHGKACDVATSRALLAALADAEQRSLPYDTL